MNLTGVPRTLAAVMSHISAETSCAGWLAETEWVLWRALLDWRETGRAYWSPGARFPDDITDYMPGLDALHKAAGGWVWWLNGETFVPTERWLRLARLKAAYPYRENVELLRMLEAGDAQA